jgi:hypothetical protein
MGYIGLLLNAPYKIDSMMRMRLMMRLDSFLISPVVFFDVFWGYMNQKDKMGKEGSKGGYPGFWGFEGVTLVTSILRVCSRFYRSGSYSPLWCAIGKKQRNKYEIYQASSPSILSLSGGGRL